MIKMLSSSAILADSEQRARASSNKACVSSTDSQPAGAPQTRTPRLKSKVLKSQSLSFDQVSGRSLLARPSSRIIFDPTSSQFHISDSTLGRPSDEQQSLTSGLSFDSSSSSSSDSSSYPAALADRSAQLLLDTQQQIIGLKSLASSDEQLVVPASSPAVGPLSAGVRRRSPVGSALRSLFGTSRHSTVSGSNSADTGGPPRRLATVVRHGSLRCPSLTGEPSLACSRAASPPAPGSRESSMNRYTGLGSDLLQRASRKLSASSSSLTSKFKFIASTASGQQAGGRNSQCLARDGDSSAASILQQSAKSRLAQTQTSTQVSQFNCHPSSASRIMRVIDS